MPASGYDSEAAVHVASAEKVQDAPLPAAVPSGRLNWRRNHQRVPSDPGVLQGEVVDAAAAVQPNGSQLPPATPAAADVKQPGADIRRTSSALSRLIHRKQPPPPQPQQQQQVNGVVAHNRASNSQSASTGSQQAAAAAAAAAPPAAPVAETGRFWRWHTTPKDVPAKPSAAFTDSPGSAAAPAQPQLPPQQQQANGIAFPHQPPLSSPFANGIDEKQPPPDEEQLPDGSPMTRPGCLGLFPGARAKPSAAAAAAAKAAAASKACAAAGAAHSSAPGAAHPGAAAEAPAPAAGASQQTPAAAAAGQSGAGTSGGSALGSGREGGSGAEGDGGGSVQESNSSSIAASLPGADAAAAAAAAEQSKGGGGLAKGEKPRHRRHRSLTQLLPKISFKRGEGNGTVDEGEQGSCNSSDQSDATGPAQQQDNSSAAGPQCSPDASPAAAAAAAANANASAMVSIATPSGKPTPAEKAMSMSSSLLCLRKPAVMDELSSDSGSDDEEDDAAAAGPPSLPDGIAGLRNLGNTCFINAALQCLRFTPGLALALAPELRLPPPGTQPQPEATATAAPAALVDVAVPGTERDDVTATAPAAAAAGEADAKAGVAGRSGHAPAGTAEGEHSEAVRQAPQEGKGAREEAKGEEEEGGALYSRASVCSCCSEPRPPGGQTACAQQQQQQEQGTPGTGAGQMPAGNAVSQREGEEPSRPGQQQQGGQQQQQQPSAEQQPPPAEQQQRRQAELKGAMAHEFVGLLRQLFAPRPPSATNRRAPCADPSALVRVLGSLPGGCDLCDGGQHDCQEAFRLLLDRLHEDLNQGSRPSDLDPRAASPAPPSAAAAATPGSAGDSSGSAAAAGDHTVAFAPQLAAWPGARAGANAKRPHTAAVDAAASGGACAAVARQEGAPTVAAAAAVEAPWPAVDARPAAAAAAAAAVAVATAAERGEGSRGPGPPPAVGGVTDTDNMAGPLSSSLARGPHADQHQAQGGQQQQQQAVVGEEHSTAPQQAKTTGKTKGKTLVRSEAAARGEQQERQQRQGRFARKQDRAEERQQQQRQGQVEKAGKEQLGEEEEEEEGNGGGAGGELGKAESLWRECRARDESAITDLFGGQLQSSVHCHKCGGRFTTYEPFLDLSLPLAKEGGGGSGLGAVGARASSWFGGGGSKGGHTIQDCLRVFTADELLQGKEAFSCDVCGERTTATKRLRVHRFPRALVLHIKRFKYSSSTREKLTSPVTYPERCLKLHQFASDEALSAAGGLPSGLPGAAVFDLYAVSVHTGSMVGGHYTATCRVRLPADADAGGGGGCREEWWSFNDDHTHRVQGPANSSAYMLFYVRRDWRREAERGPMPPPPPQQHQQRQ